MADLPASRGTEKGRYVYDPLDGRPDDTLRILHLQPGSGEDVLQCSLSLARCSDKPRYAALSYVWETSKTTIMVNHQQLSVPASLSSFLSQLRHPRECLPLWADAICVDQENLKERGHQVQLMGYIYANATVVFAWLGEDTCQVASSLGALPKLSATLDTLNTSGIAIPAVKLQKLGEPESTNSIPDENVRNPASGETSQHGEKAIRESDIIRSCTLQSDACALEDRQDPSKRTLKTGGTEIRERPQAWEAMVDICQRKYWTRLWIVQEIMLAQSVVLCIGASRVLWVDFVRLVRVCDARYPGCISKETRTWEERWRKIYCTSCPMYQFTNSGTYTKKKQFLGRLLELWRWQMCNDPRDRIYALLSLAYEPTSSRGFRPSYEKCVLCLCCEVAKAYRNKISVLHEYLGVSFEDIKNHAGHHDPRCLCRNRDDDYFSPRDAARALASVRVPAECHGFDDLTHSRSKVLWNFGKVKSAMKLLRRRRLKSA